MPRTSTEPITQPAPTLTAAEPAGIDSDRLFADWQLKTRRVTDLANGLAAHAETVPPKADVVIDIPANWLKLCKENPEAAKQEQLRVRGEFEQAFAAGLVAAGFERSLEQPRYLLYNREDLKQRGAI